MLSLVDIHFMQGGPFCPEGACSMEASWAALLADELKKPYMHALTQFLSEELVHRNVIYPPLAKIFNAFCFASFEAIKVVLIGQDPYHGEGQAEGLSFSVPRGTPLPPSLVNIFKELKTDCAVSMPPHGSLESWAQQGVLLLNATLTVRAGSPKSHHGRGWEQFTDRVVQLLAERADPLVFLLWGKSAYEKGLHVREKGGQHLVLTAPHPSPLSAHTGFFGSRPFSQTNEFLKRIGKEPITWAIS